MKERKKEWKKEWKIEKIKNKIKNKKVPQVRQKVKKKESDMAPPPSPLQEILIPENSAPHFLGRRQLRTDAKMQEKKEERKTELDR